MKKTLLSLLAAGSFSLVALSCQGSTISNACTTDTDCEKGESCFLAGFPGGFCTRGCTREGALNECPGGTICTRTSGVNPTTFCSLPCNDDGQCRGGEYVCRPVTGTDKKACSP